PGVLCDLDKVSGRSDDRNRDRRWTNHAAAQAAAMAPDEAQRRMEQLSLELRMIKDDNYRIREDQLRLEKELKATGAWPADRGGSFVGVGMEGRGGYGAGPDSGSFVGVGMGRGSFAGVGQEGRGGGGGGGGWGQQQQGRLQPSQSQSQGGNRVDADQQLSYMKEVIRSLQEIDTRSQDLAECARHFGGVGGSAAVFRCLLLAASAARRLFSGACFWRRRRLGACFQVPAFGGVGACFQVPAFGGVGGSAPRRLFSGACFWRRRRLGTARPLQVPAFGGVDGLGRGGGGGGEETGKSGGWESREGGEGKERGWESRGGGEREGRRSGGSGGREEDSFRPSPEMENLAIMKDEFLEQSLEGLASQSLETFASLQGQPEQSISKVTVEDVEKEMKRLELELQKRGVDWSNEEEEILVAIAGTDRSPGPRVGAPRSAAASGDLEEPSGDFDEVVVEGLEAEPLVDALPEDVAAKEALASFRGRSDNSIGFGDAMRSLDTYAKGSKSREHDQETFHSHLQTSVRVGCWTLILALPIIIWPVAVHLKSMGRSESEYLSFWGSMLLQFLFCIGPTLGASVQYTVEGFFGTTIATVNMFFLNYVMGFWLRGGAFANRLEIFDPETNITMIRSRWLPLCSNSNDYSFENCFLNIDLDRVEGAELAKALFVLADLVLVVFVVLSIGFNLNTRVFGLSTHVYFVMSFLDPNTGSFYTAPTLATHYWIIVACASFAVLLCFLIPFPITSYAKAHKMAEGSGLAVAMILESLPLTSTELCREKVQSAIEEADVVSASEEAVLLADLAVEFRGCRGPSLVFALALCGIVKDTSHAVSVVTHPRFVLRNTFTIFIAFMLGWIGVSNTLASYSSGPASTASVIMYTSSYGQITYTFTGASLPITLKRLNGVVLGAVIGSVAQRLFAIQSIGHAICYGVFIIAFVSFFIFHALHSKQNANVACLTVGYGISAMMPPGGIMRELAVKVNSSSNSSLFARVVGTALMFVALMFVDALLASSARHQARQRLVRSLNLTSKLVAKVLSPGGAAGEEKDEDTSGADLSRALKEAELEKGLRTLAEHFGTLGWAIQLLEETPQRRRILRAGSFAFSDKMIKKENRPSSPSATLMRTEMFKPILATLGNELQLMLANIAILAEDLTQERHLAQRLRPKTDKEEERDAEAEKVREVLQEKLYTRAVGSAFSRVAVSPWRAAWNTAKGSAAARTARMAYQKAQEAKKRNELVSNE
ncbi:unnamed protein product, partial [Polarella glacialis]